MTITYAETTAKENLVSTKFGPGKVVLYLQVHGSVFQNLVFFKFHLKNHRPKDVNLKFELKGSDSLDIRSSLYFQLPMHYCVNLIIWLP